MITSLKKLKQYLPALLMIVAFLALATHANAQTPTILVSEQALGFKIPSLSDILTFVIRLFFVIAGLAALFYMLLGAFEWITSGGSKDGVDKARNKIQAAVVGIILIVVVLAIIATLEQVVFQGRIGFGLTVPVTIPSILKAPGSP